MLWTSEEIYKYRKFLAEYFNLKLLVVPNSPGQMVGGQGQAANLYNFLARLDSMGENP